MSTSSSCSCSCLLFEDSCTHQKRIPKINVNLKVNKNAFQHRTDRCSGRHMFFPGVYDVASCLVPCSFQEGFCPPPWTDRSFWKHYLSLWSAIVKKVGSCAISGQIIESCQFQKVCTLSKFNIRFYYGTFLPAKLFHILLLKTYQQTVIAIIIWLLKIEKVLICDNVS